MCTAHGENFGRGKSWRIWRIMSCSPKFSLPLFRYTKNVFGICTHCNLFANFFLTNTSYLYDSPKFPLPKFSHVRYLYLYLNTSEVLAFYLSTSPKTMVCTCTCTSTNVKVLVLYLRWLRTIHVWLHHKN